jgi:hypothetical protein
MYFNGSAGCYLSLPAGSLVFGTQDFTIEFWYYRSVTAPQQLFRSVADSSFAAISIGDSSGTCQVYCSSNGTTWDTVSLAAAGTLTLNAWNHIALRRVGSIFTVFVNGIQTATVTSALSLVNNAAHTPVIGGQSTGNITTGYIDDFRITLGKGRYTVEPTAAL